MRTIFQRPCGMQRALKGFRRAHNHFEPSSHNFLRHRLPSPFSTLIMGLFIGNDVTNQRIGVMAFPVLTGIKTGLWVLITMFMVGCGHLGGAASSESPARVLLEKPGWPHTDSDLAPDPNLVFGRLDNGFRFVMMENKTPRNRVSMHLYVQSGSLAEFEGEEGIAHFLEHMLFDGSTHFPPGELVKYFQRIGMQFGPDANAHTGFGQTVYDILLPNGDAQSIADGLLVLRDFAGGALLLPDEVEKEKQVVLAEKRARDSARYRTLQATFKFEMPGSLLSDRFPIGTTESILAFDAAKLRRFYDAWYRPDRMILVMAGDFDRTLAIPLVQSQFEGMQARSDRKELPPFGHFDHQGVETFYHQETEMGSTTVGIETVAQYVPLPDSGDRQKKDLLEELANRTMQWRLDSLVRATGGIMTRATVGSGEYLQQIRYSDISADCRSEHWEEVLVLLENALRKAIVFGFTPSELERAKKSLHADLKRDVDEMRTRESRALAQQIMDSFNRWEVFQSPSQRQQLLGPMIDRIDLADVNKAFSSLWPDDHRLVLVTGNADLAGADMRPEELILSHYLSSSQKPVEPPADMSAGSFPYLETPVKMGTVQKQERLEDLGIEKVLFENGVSLILKQTDFKNNEITATLSFGLGKSSEPPDQPGLAVLTEALINESGFGRMDRIELENALAGRLAEIVLDVREDMFVLDGHASSSELPLLLQLFYTMLNDPGYRPESLEIALKQFRQKHHAMLHSVEGLMQLQGAKLLGGGDSRLGWPAWQQIKERTIVQIERWFGTQLAQAPLEIAIVGDFSVDEAIRLVSAYFGSLPVRSLPVTAIERPGPIFPRGESFSLKVDTAIDRGLVVVAYPTDDFWDIRRTRRLSVLSEIFSERLRVQVREKLGASYSPYTYHHASRAYDGYGLLQAMLLVDPKHVETIAREVERIGSNLRAQDIGQDELRRALDPTLVQIKDMRQSNRYWLNSVLTGSSRHPEQIDWARSIENDYAAINAVEISAFARQYLNNSQAAKILFRWGKEPQ